MPLTPQEEQIIRNTAWLDHLHEQFEISKKSVGREWSAVSVRQRRAICFDAQLRPSTYAEMTLEEMQPAERESIRQSVIALGMQSLFSGGCDAISWQAAFRCAADQATPEKNKRELLSAARLRQQARTMRNISHVQGPRPIGQ
ncbi:hypothetical protein [Aeromonas sp. BIGb0445]|uniref:hypothetical protein n=1 Tax=Aeromonas sp. BIGb0445 TaxID=2940593 RepID=UPI002167123D|nr:hypothetical protein [Aeromonas sp. BIGb0445]MCS3461638.1 hypothetical protein [Aeromonas sp. BIGb0445]